ncbi:Nucleotide-binding alpha-beta plait domain [Phytophthora cactorum]|nr:Nucleotide-binding alpha-beta plait domain [Phytophthora cactorum]
MGTRVYVGGLPRDATSREIQDGFSRYGHVSNIWVARNPPGFAFVDFEDPRDADDAIRSMDGRDFLGGRIRVELARGGSRRDGGGGGGGRRDDDRNGRGGGGDRRNPPQRTDYRVRVTDLPRDVDWRNVKDFLRTGGEVTYCNIEADGSAIAEFQSKEDMEDAVKKLDDTEFRGSYVRVAPEGDSSRRSRSRSPARGRSPSRRSRSRSPAARKDSPRRSRSRSASPAAGRSPPRKNSA